MTQLIINKRFQILFIVIITFFVYSNIFQNGFTWDDPDVIVNRYETRSFENLPLFLKGIEPVGYAKAYRPVREIFYAISYKLWGLNPIGYHFQSILIHLISSVLVYFIVLEVTKKSIVAFMSSLIFGVHPIHTEAITNMSISFNFISAIFLFASFYLYIKAQSNEDKKRLYYFLSILLALLAFFTYELTLSIPLLIILYDSCFKKINKENLVKKIMVYSLYFASALFYVFVRIYVVKIGARGGYLAGSFYHTVLTIAKAFLKYILLVVFPINLNVDHTISKGILSLAHSEYNTEAIRAQSVFDLHILFSVAVIAALLFIAVKSFKKYPLVSFSIGWFFIALSPVSNIIPQQVILAERYAYMASFGFCLLFSYGIYNAYNLASNKMRYVKFGLILFFVLSLIFYSATTLARNWDWKDELTLWSKTAEQSPQSTSAHNNLGNAYLDQKKLELAIEEYKKAISLNPYSDEAHNNLGNAYQSQGNLNLAIEEYKKSLAINPNYDKAHNNLGLAYQSQGKAELAIEEYKTAITLNPNNDKYHYNLGIAYQSQGKAELAIEEYKTAITLNPNNDNTRYNLGIAYQSQGKAELAIEEYKKVIAINPNDAYAYNNLGTAYQAQGKMDLAIEAYKKALDLDPNNAKARSNLNRAYKIQEG